MTAPAKTRKTCPAAASVGINDLPDEMLVYIFKFLKLHDTVTVYAKTCLHWRETIARHILSPEIFRVAQYDQPFRKSIVKEGWTEECGDPNLIMRLYDKYEYYKVTCYWGTR